LTLLLILLLAGMTRAKSQDLTLYISGLRNDEGRCLVNVFNQPKGFPTDPSAAMKSASGPIRDGRCTITLDDLPAGEYAISVLHDQNGNGKPDTNFLGIPKEGIGTSNNAKGRLGPPAYADCRFTYAGQAKSIFITIQYL
jgi:uncharacterized protein (DUF2141 family)